MRIAVLTSSRADYGIYLPLLEGLRQSPDFELELVVFGTHLSRFHGYTINQIEADGFKPDISIDSMPVGDSPAAIVGAMGTTMIRFSSYWESAKDRLQLAICLGDRFEMFAAASASIPFNIPLAHIHGGETTVGAIDDVFRHSLTHMASLHFTSTEEYANRVRALTGVSSGVHNVGALSLDQLAEFDFFGKEEFKERFGCSVDSNTILVTLHPETRSLGNILDQAKTVASCLEQQSDHDVLITMPNADTSGSIIREVFNDLAERNPDRMFLVENLGRRGYFTAMKRAAFLLGNSSSGLIEAASFQKWVINIGDRQKGRISGANVLHVPYESIALARAIERLNKMGDIEIVNPYFNGGATERILRIIGVFGSRNAP